MSDRTFIDTNVLVYMFDTSEVEKQSLAQQTFARVAPNSVVSAQVLSEFYVVATRKLDEPLPVEVAARVVREMSRLEVVFIDDQLVSGAIDVSIGHDLSFWDSLVVMAAVRAGCDTLLTEDLNDGQEIEGVRVHNPFLN